MDKSFFIRCNQFQAISKKYYQKYCEEKERHNFLVEYQFLYERDAEWIMEMFENSERRDEYAIIAIVFQAMAVEAYINLAGEYIVCEGFDKIYRKSAVGKLKVIENKCGGSSSDVMKTCIECLFDKRNELVHHKPKPFSLGEAILMDDEQTKREAECLLKEVSFIEEDIETNMEVYGLLQEELKQVRGSSMELIEEIQFDVEKSKINGEM